MKPFFPGSRKKKITLLASLIILIIGSLLRFFNPEPGVEDVEGVARVIDGDSIVVAGREIRLQGIDAPEGRQTCERGGKSWACGNEARRELQKLTRGGKVFCKALELDKHKRLLALCRVGRVDVNRQMVASGFAVSYGRFKDAEQSAKAARKGLWSGEFQRPRDWRRERNIGR